MFTKYDLYYDKKGPPTLGKRNFTQRVTRSGTVAVPKMSREQRVKKRAKFHEKTFNEFVAKKTHLVTNDTSIVQDPPEKLAVEEYPIIEERPLIISEVQDLPPPPCPEIEQIPLTETTPILEEVPVPE